jgi:hypothetical protein
VTGVAAWKRWCGMSWAISLVNHGQRPAYFDQRAATVEQLGATRSVLRQVITLADDAATLPDKELRDPAAGTCRVCPVPRAANGSIVDDNHSRRHSRTARHRMPHRVLRRRPVRCQAAADGL